MSDLLGGDPRIARWAEVIVDFCTEVQPGERVEITGEIEGKALMLALFRRCLDRGAFPVLRPSFSETAEIFYRYASMDQLSRVDPTAVFDAEHTQVSLHVLAESNSANLSSVTPDRIAAVRKARKDLGRIRKEKIRWNVTSYPTHGSAQDAGMSLADFAEFVMEAGLLNTPDPMAAWRQLRKRQQTMTQALQGVRSFRIVNAGADLTLGVENRRICESSGCVNMPDGEIYTGPVETDVNGFINFSFPGYYMGQVVNGIQLVFEKGRVVNARADHNESFLLEMLNTDDGASRIGELGIGTNWGIQRFTKNLLFDEKMGGTIHLALGDSYRETLGENRSAIHWDILHDLRNDGRVYADNEIFLENGAFVGRFQEIWCNGYTDCAE